VGRIGGGAIAGTINNAVVLSEGEIYFVPPTEEVNFASFVTIPP
jgi:hypothetical protein